MSKETRDRSQRELMDQRGVGALLLSSPANFAWYTGGADNRVDHSDPVGVASVLLTGEDSYILTNNIEAPRMREEQTPGMEVVEHPWHEEPAELLRELTGDASVGTDVSSGFGQDLSAEIPPLRYVLDEDAARLSAACVERGISVPVLLAAAGSRLVRYRHPVPHGGPLGKQAMLVACAERSGLFVSVTRMIYFEEPD